MNWKTPDSSSIQPYRARAIAILGLVLVALGLVACVGMTPVSGSSPSEASMPLVDKAYAADASLQLADAADAALVEPQSSKTSEQKPSKAQLRAFRKSTADFSVELLARSVAGKGKNANVTVSPLSMVNALAMCANGAAGTTRAEMSDVLADGASVGRMNANLKWYNSTLTNSSKARLSMGNAVWYHNDAALKMNKKFVKTCKNTFGAEVKKADFSNPNTVTTINKWVATKTNNMIKRVFSQINPADRIALVNALYFEAKWKNPFLKENVTTDVFTDARGIKHKVQMMNGIEGKYLEGYGARGFIKPYAKGYSYVALLPEEGTSLKQFCASLTGDKLRRLLAHASDQRVRIKLPKYTVTYSNEKMKEQLEAMGMKTAFSPSADFSKMGSDASGKLMIGKVVHKTKVIVDEDGTKAAAATGAMMMAGSALNPDEKVVNLDRPFVYAIIDNKVKLPVFIGAVNSIE